MSTYRLGSNGEEVERIRAHLSELGFYRGPLTWRALFGRTIPSPAIAAKPLDYQCLALTGSLESDSPLPECFAGLSGDFDGQGTGFGAVHGVQCRLEDQFWINLNAV
ncbi:MAG: hypothetical protein Q8S05_03580 [Sulfuricella sp.]|nr:hypothetical protein [Sulfuricella sp.]